MEPAVPAVVLKSNDGDPAAVESEVVAVVGKGFERKYCSKAWLATAAILGSVSISDRIAYSRLRTYKFQSPESQNPPNRHDHQWRSGRR
jgi:hypothetical protein